MFLINAAMIWSPAIPDWQTSMSPHLKTSKTQINFLGYIYGTSSRISGLDGETDRLKKNQNHAIIEPKASARYLT